MEIGQDTSRDESFEWASSFSTELVEIYSYSEESLF